MIYEVISKVLAGRLKGILGDIVQLNQVAFILRRNIADNILLAHELLQGYHKDKYDCCAMKVDLQKAYDSVSRNFVEEIMIALRFPGHIITLAMVVVRSCMFSIMVNGQLEGFFLGKKF